MLILTVPQKVEIIMRPERGESCSIIMASYNTGSSTIYEKRNRKINYV
jgi:hypothetical protein